MISNKKKSQEDTWTYQQVLTPFPQSVVKAIGETNMYVALWYRHGKPVMGKAWNDSGVMQCEFAVDGRSYAGPDVGGKIQLLTYEGSHDSNLFYYEWIPLSNWKLENTAAIPIHVAVHCGSSAPIYWKEHQILGNYDIEAKKGTFIVGGKFTEVSDQLVLASMMILVRNTQGAPPHCPCAKCNAANASTTQKPLMVNDWGDFCWGQKWPGDKPMTRALGRNLTTPAGPQEHVVALWYRHGKPLMGRAWRNKEDKIEASFTDGGKEFTGECVGSLQILVELPATAAGFDYCWLPYEQASKYQDKDFAPVHINHIAPCVITDVKNKEMLGQVNLKQERAEVAFGGKVVVVEGPPIKPLKVLCRRDRDDIASI